jgi:hypothetical protein
MKILKISLLLISVAFLWFFTKTPPLPVEECANEFSSHYYSDYHSQLQAFVNQHSLFPLLTESSQQIKDLVRHINQPLENAIQQREVHANFVKILRTAIDSIQQFSQSEKVFLQELTHWIFIRADLKEATKLYFDPYTKDPIKNDFSNLMATLHTLRKSQIFSRSPHETTHQIDQYRHGNIPFLLFTLKGPIQTKVLRMGYPMDTINRLHLPWISPQVYPEFLFFIQTQSSHLYVNLMKRNGTESSATKALELLENDFSNFSAVTIDKNSDFYWQDKHQYPAIMDAAAFKKEFLKQLTNKNGDFYWSKNLNIDEWTLQLNFIIDKTHQSFFANQTMLNQKERLDFIELSYLSILDALVDQLRPASMNITCRQCMDRGPSLYVLWMLQKNEVTEAELPALLLAPPLLIHNRPSHPSRIIRFISAAQRIASFQ